MKNPWFLPSAMLLLGAVGGFLSGRNTSSTSESSSGGDASRPTRSAQRSDASRSADATNKRSPRPGGMDEISRMPGNSNRIQALIAFNSGLSPDQLEDEARKLESLPMNERIMASFLLFGRWAEVWLKSRFSPLLERVSLYMNHRVT